MDVNFNSKNFNSSNLQGLNNVSAEKRAVSEEKNSLKSENFSKGNINIISISVEELEEQLRTFDFKGIETVRNLDNALEKEKNILLKEQQEAMGNKEGKELNFFELAVKSIEKLTGKSLGSILDEN